MPRLSSRRSRSLALLLWVLAVVLPQAARGPMGVVPRPGHVRPRTGRSRPEAAARSSEQAVLAHARGSAFIPGTNLRGQSGGAAFWLSLLPGLEFGLVVCVGAPSAAVLRALARNADELLVCGRGRERWRVARAGIPGIRVVAPQALPAHRPGLVLVSGKRGTLVAADAAALEHAARSGSAGPISRERRRALRAADGIASGRLQPPEYIREIAAAHGVQLDGYRVGLGAPTDYASRKAVMFLFRGDEPEPELVVKLARDERQNKRIENEWRALHWLIDANVPGHVPRPAFFGHHAGLALVGQSALTGAPFRARTTALPDCPLALAALEWLLDLGRATAHPAPAGGVSDAMADLASRFHALYRLTRRERSALCRHVDALASAGSSLSLVLQHGDPGGWNLLVGSGGTPAFLDWEAAERHGMPLWDAFYFARSFAVTVARAKRRTSRLRAVRRELLTDGPVSRLLASQVERHCAAIGLDESLVEPLFVTCWMHRALKEATRLPAARLDSGHYVNLLRLCLS